MWQKLGFHALLLKPLKTSFCLTDPCLSRGPGEGEFTPFLLSTGQSLIYERGDLYEWRLRHKGFPLARWTGRLQLALCA